jgi:protein TonB
MLQVLSHTLNIGTLATWLSVAVFGTVGVGITGPGPDPDRHPEPLESQWIAEDFTLGGESAPEILAPSGAFASPSEPAEILPEPPEMPEVTDLEPLPDIPEPPLAAPAAAAPRETPPALKPRQSTRPETGVRTPRTSAGTAGASQSSPAGKPGGGSVMSASARLAAGNMPPPSYPSEARRKGQTGTVVIEFTVDTSGRVISADAKSPSPWPQLNQEAVRTVRRWNFPPGGVMKLQRPIVFQLR